MTLARTVIYSFGVTCALSFFASTAHAEPDPDPEGAVRALWSIPLDSAADAVAAGGLISAAVVGVAGDLVALVDHNEFTHPSFAESRAPAFVGALWASRGSLLAHSRGFITQSSRASLSRRKPI